MTEPMEGDVVGAQDGPQEGWLISYVAQRLQVSPKRVRNLITEGTLQEVPGTSPKRLTEDSVTAYEAKRVRKVEEGRQSGLTWEQLDTGPISPYVALSALVVEACEQIGKLSQSVEVLKRSQERLSYEVGEALTPKPRAIGAGPRKATTTVRRDDVDAAMRTLARHYTTAELADALRALGPEEVITGAMRLAGRELQEDREERQGTS